MFLSKSSRGQIGNPAIVLSAFVLLREIKKIAEKKAAGLQLRNPAVFRY
jgi:hypothetical protein